MRLKRGTDCPSSGREMRSAMNYKNLNYEIETMVKHICVMLHLESYEL